MTDGKKSTLPEWVRREIVVLALGFAGGVVGALFIGSIWLWPELDKDHALLSGPLLLFVAVIVLLAVFHRPLGNLLNRGNLTLSWGDKKISIQEIEENFDQELEARLDALKSDIEDLRLQIGEPAGGPKPQADGEPSAKQAAQSDSLSRLKEGFGLDSREQALLVYHLGASPYKWRNQRTLAKRSGLPDSTIGQLANDMPSLVIRSRGKSGNTIFRLNDDAKRRFGGIITSED
ncbi:MAG: hypothetical protein AAF495_12490 [Pseudomonadota bacterium]